MKQRITISLPEEQIVQLKPVLKRNGAKLSSLISVKLDAYLNSQKAVEA